MFPVLSSIPARRRVKTGVFLIALIAGWHTARSADAPRVIDGKTYHLGTAGAPEWFDSGKPDAQRLEVTFTAEANATPWTLVLRQSGVKLGRRVELNGQKLGNLVGSEQALVNTFAIPAGGLRAGMNTLTIPPTPGVDDIAVGDFKLIPQPLQEALHEAMLEVAVSDQDSGSGLPCRITVTDEKGALAVLDPEPGQTLAARPGVIYTRDGQARFGLMAGRYTVYATRGFEYGVDSRTITVAAGTAQRVPLVIRREVPTPGLVSCDTHIHTLTFSKHGDATIEERMLTIAGEGIELPISTDHNYHTDYAEPAVQAGVRSYFSPVMGNEVTTKVGHFNAFPIKPGSPVADFQATNWPELLRSIRATPGVKVVTLNHPRDEHGKFVPFGAANFNAVTGDVLFSPEFSFDAMEVITSGAMQSDPMRLYRDWFALLNHGYRLASIASSDTHDVARYILGQARTYVACDDHDPANLNVEAACESFLKGRVLVSMGLLTQMAVDGKFTVGDLATGLGEKIKVEITVRGPSWTQTDRLELFANGVRICEEAITPGAAVEKAHITWMIPRPPQDAHLVAIATGPGIRAPYCETPRPYQPASPDFHPRVMGSTNPIWLDGDGDGQFTAARAYAQQVVDQNGTDPARLLPALARYDEAVAVLAAALCVAAGRDLQAADFAAVLKQAPTQIQSGFAAFAESQTRH
jgi:hypothetical protein